MKTSRLFGFAGFAAGLMMAASAALAASPPPLISTNGFNNWTQGFALSFVRASSSVAAVVGSDSFNSPFVVAGLSGAPPLMEVGSVLNDWKQIGFASFDMRFGLDHQHASALGSPPEVGSSPGVSSSIAQMKNEGFDNVDNGRLVLDGTGRHVSVLKVAAIVARNSSTAGFATTMGAG